MKGLTIGDRVVVKNGGFAWEYGPIEASFAAPAFEHANLGRRLRLRIGQTGVITGLEGPADDPSAYYVCLEARGRQGREVRLFLRQVTQR